MPTPCSSFFCASLRSAFLLLPALPLAAADAGSRDSGPPGVVVATSPVPDTQFIGSPSIAILPDGSYVASHDFFGKVGPDLRSARVFGSRDRGASWTQLAQFPDATWGTLFVHRGALHHMGITHEYGDIVLRRSIDGGKTWTTPAAGTGVLFKGKFHSAPVPVVEHGGRIWRAVEEVVNDLLWPRHFGALVISAPVDSDLLVATNWTRTNSLGFDSAWVTGRRPGWLEGNMVPAPDGRIVNLLRTNTELNADAPMELTGGAAGIPRFELAARADVSRDGKTLTFDPTKGFFRLPGSQSKFTIRYDPVSKRYWSLVNKLTVQHEAREVRTTALAQRNVVLLVSSADLSTWREHSKVLRWNEGAKLTRQDKFAFQYPDWQFDGQDLVMVSRTAWNAQSFHNANYLTFHRISNFRTLTMADSAPDVGRGSPPE